MMIRPSKRLVCISRRQETPCMANTKGRMLGLSVRLFSETSLRQHKEAHMHRM